MIQRLVVASLPSRTPMRGVPMRYQDDVVKSMCDAYAAAVNAGDSEAYRDSSRRPPSGSRRGRSSNTDPMRSRRASRAVTTRGR
jgi:hypothetical protein